jgi:hypothetical protein
MYSVFGLGNPLLDFIAPAEPQVLEALDAKKGTMNLVDRDGMERVLAKLTVTRTSPEEVRPTPSEQFPGWTEVASLNSRFSAVRSDPTFGARPTTAA